MFLKFKERTAVDPGQTGRMSFECTAVRDSFWCQSN